MSSEKVYMVTADKQKRFIVADAIDSLNAPEPLDMLKASDKLDVSSSEPDVFGEPEIGEHVGQFTFTVRMNEDTSSTDLRFNNRANALTAWLLAKWRYEQALGHINN
jgi:hypothetical protein